MKESDLGGEFPRVAGTSRDLLASGEGLENRLYGAVEDEIAPFKLWEFAILRAFFAKEELTVTQLARAYPTDPSRISRVMNKLVKKGLISKVCLPSDQRVVKLRLTDEGKDTVRELCGRVLSLGAIITKDISYEELIGFLNTMRKMKANYETVIHERGQEVPSSEKSFSQMAAISL